MTTPTTTIQERLAQLPYVTLDKGNHESFESGHCALELVAWLAGDDHTDHPVCMSPVIAAFVRRWNDDLSDADRTPLLRPVLPRLIGTAADAATESRREWMIVDWFIRVSTPAWLNLLPALQSDAAALRALPEIVHAEMATAAMPALEGARQRASDTRVASWEGAGTAAQEEAGISAGISARAASMDAERQRLAITIETLQQEALVLLDRLIQVPHLTA